jgi:sporulation protein YlmC with PRC-barrel domain
MSNERGARVETYVIVRRSGWSTPDEVANALARANAGGDAPDDVAWVRSYVLAETDGTLGTMCVYQAASPEAVRAHARGADLPVDEIVKVADTVVVRPDPAAVAA